MNSTLRSQVETYLAVKYGITRQGNYVAGSNTIYTVSGYGTHVAGIGKDNTFGLNQKVGSSESTSASTSSNVVVSTTNNFTASNLNSGRTALSEGQYLIWGHNNGSTSSWSTTGSYKHVTRRWKIQNTGSVGAVNFQINLSSYPSAQFNYYLIVDNDTDLSNGVSNTYQLSESGNLYSCAPTFANGTNYFTIGFEPVDVDLGDAPNTYSTLVANNGPIHVIVSGKHLGSGVSADTNGFRDGTDNNGDATDDTNDDGVTFNPSLGISTVNIVEAGALNTLRINASASGYVSAWLDLNLDGDFADSGEKIINNSSVSSGNNDINFSVTNNNKHGISYARIRYYTSSGEVTSYTGVANSGEVEDYKVYITADRPTDVCSNLIVNASFETPTTGSNGQFTDTTVEGWNSSVNQVEIWNTGSVSGIPSQAGSQLAELNVSGVTTYFQDVVTVPGETMSWQIYHRGRSGTDQINFKLGAPGNTSSVQNISTGTSWTQYTGSYTVPSGQYVTRFEIVTVSPTNGGGNLLDNIRFIVSDNTNPVITSSQQNVTVNNTSCTYLVSGTGLNATATDNCAVSTLTHNYDGGGSSLDGKSFSLGTTDVTWTATDVNGNSATQVMQVIVSTNLAVSLSGPASNASCGGASAVFTATGSGGNPTYSYSFYVNNTVVTNGVSGNTFTTSTLSNNDVIKVKITDSYGCSVFSSDLTMTIHSQPNPVLYHE